MRHLSFVAYMLIWALLCLFSPTAVAQDASAPSPADWPELSLKAFLDEMDRLTTAAEPPSDELWKEIRSQSAQRLLAADAEVNCDQFLTLFVLGRSSLTDEQQQAALERLNGAAAEEDVSTLAQLRAKCRKARLPKESIQAMVAAWLTDRDLSLLNRQQVEWLLDDMEHSADFRSRTFSVVWTGSIEVPSNGDYTFSICPVNLNVKHDIVVQHSMAVSIDNQQVLNATPEDWSPKSDPVSLQAGRKTPIRVEFSYECAHGIANGIRPAVARLMWQGPGITKRLVPTTVLTPPEGEGSGLRADYRFDVDGQERALTRTESVIDRIWSSPAHAALKYPELRSRLVARMWELLTDPEYLTTYETDPKPQAGHRLIAGPGWLLWCFDASQRASWVGELLARPALLESASREVVAGLYRHCRFGAPDQALQMLGAWARTHPDPEPEFSTGFYDANRNWHRFLATRIIWDYRPHFDVLEDQYLELPDGGCCLTVAYTLSYGHWEEGRILEWIDKLQSRLEDDQLTGDRRVNWLLARAQAEEIRRGRPNRNWYTVERTLAGYGWLQEACLVAQTEPVRLRAYKELATRLAADAQVDAARQMLAAAAQRCTAAESIEALATWQKELDQLTEKFEKLYAKQEAKAQQNYINTIRQRHQKAVDRGDLEAAARYEQILTDSGAQPE